MFSSPRIRLTNNLLATVTGDPLVDDNDDDNNNSNNNENGDDFAMVDVTLNNTSIPGKHRSPLESQMNEGEDTTSALEQHFGQWTSPDDDDDPLLLGDADHQSDMSSNETVQSLYDPSLELSPESPPTVEPTGGSDSRTLDSLLGTSWDANNKAHFLPFNHTSMTVTAATPWNDVHNVKNSADSKPCSTTTLLWTTTERNAELHHQIQQGCGFNELYHDSQSTETSNLDDVTESSFHSPTKMTFPEINHHAPSSSAERNENEAIGNALVADENEMAEADVMPTKSSPLISASDKCSEKMVDDEGCSTDQHASSSSRMHSDQSKSLVRNGKQANLQRGERRSARSSARKAVDYSGEHIIWPTVDDIPAHRKLKPKKTLGNDKEVSEKRVESAVAEVETFDMYQKCISSKAGARKMEKNSVALMRQHPADASNQNENNGILIIGEDAAEISEKQDFESQTPLPVSDPDSSEATVASSTSNNMEKRATSDSQDLDEIQCSKPLLVCDAAAQDLGDIDTASPTEQSVPATIPDKEEASGNNESGTPRRARRPSSFRTASNGSIKSDDSSKASRDDCKEETESPSSRPRRNLGHKTYMEVNSDGSQDESNSDDDDNDEKIESTPIRSPEGEQVACTLDSQAGSQNEDNMAGPTVHAAEDDDPKKYKNFKPSYFRTVPMWTVDAYKEYKGLDQFAHPNGPKGGIEALRNVHFDDRTWQSSLTGQLYPQHRIIKAIADMADKQRPDLTSRYSLLEELDAECLRTNANFWEFYQTKTGTKGRLPQIGKGPWCEARKLQSAPEIGEAAALATKRERVKKRKEPIECIAHTQINLKRTRKHADADVNQSETGQVTRHVVNGPLVTEQQLVPATNPHEVFREETAFLYYGVGSEGTTANKEPQALPPPPPPPSIPNHLKDVWTYCEESRVLLGNFTKFHDADIPAVHKRFFFEMMQRDDITVVSEGLLDFGMEDPETWFLNEVGKLFGFHYYHKFRRFDCTGNSATMEYEEIDGMVSMRVCDFLDYIKKRKRVMDPQANCSDDDFTFQYVDADKRPHTIEDVSKVVLYMIDIEMESHLSSLDEKFWETFRMKEVTPGGKKCMMNWMPRPSRPFMGPNLYISPGGGFTHLHQDGHGTVDSGHCVISGFNEVVMLRRMPECHKRWASQMVHATGKRKEDREYDSLYSFPHGDSSEQGARPDWPDVKTVREWSQMNYCPSIFILKPNQHVHINKGRIHAFRKVTPEKLADSDCHAALREKLVETFRGSNTEFPAVCISIAWDWMFMGADAEGMNREVSSILECASLCRRNISKALATPECALLNVASYLTQVLGKADDEARLELCRGILPSYDYLVQRELRASAHARKLLPKELVPLHERERGVLSIDCEVDIDKSPDLCSVNPRGNDYFCKLCHAELSNVYFHCDGCEILLGKDFDICIQCFDVGAYKVVYDQNPRRKHERQSTKVHTGNMVQDRRSQCPCRKGSMCKDCKFCTGCSCRCHTWFTMHWRNETDEGMRRILTKMKEIVGTNEVEYAEETITRLNIAAQHFSHDFKETIVRYIEKDKKRATRSNTPSLH